MNSGICDCSECRYLRMVDCYICEGIGEVVELDVSPFKSYTCKGCAGTGIQPVPLTEVSK